MKINPPSPRHIIESAGFYPLTALYLAGVFIAFLVVDGIMSPLYGILVFTAAVILAILAAAYNEIKSVHRLVARIERNGKPKKG
jgi:hypothetical protein